MKNRLGYSAPGPQRGQRVGRAWGFLKPQRPFFSFMIFFFPPLGSPPTLRGGRRKAEGDKPPRSQGTKRQPESQTLALPLRLGQGQSPPRHPAAFLPQRQFLRPVLGILLAPGLTGAALRGSGERGMYFFLSFFFNKETWPLDPAFPAFQSCGARLR